MTLNHTADLAPAEQSGSADGISRGTKLFMVSPIKAQVRAVVKLMQQRQRETIVFGVFYVGLGDRFDDDRRRVRGASSPG
jgi:hypothetical protein